MLAKVPVAGRGMKLMASMSGLVLTAVEVGMLSFEGAFLGQILLPSGYRAARRCWNV